MSRFSKNCSVFVPGRMTLLLLWIGLSTRAGLSADDRSYTEPPITASDRDHWSFRPLSVPEIPTHRFQGWRRNEIDDFIAAALEAKGLEPQPEASPRSLIRRLTLDLNGLLPELTEIEDFEKSFSEQTFDQIVDKLLASRAYGEHVAQAWLDLARFAETDGYEHDLVRPDAWRFRDWVVTALNKDLPYDEFVRYQIAGDLIEPGNEQAAVATQFCLSGPDMPDINSQAERRHSLLNEMSSTVGEVILGLQLGCAQCHDHKYDPVSQADFYRLRAFFETSVDVRKNVSVTTLREGAEPGATAYLMLRGDFRNPGPKVQPGMPRILESESQPFSRILLTSSQQDRMALANWLVSENHPTTARVIVNRVWQHHFGIGLCETESDFGVMGQQPVNEPLLDWLAQWLMKKDWSLKKLHRLIVRSATYRQRSRMSDGVGSIETTNWEKSMVVDPDCRLSSRFPRRRLSGEVIRDTMLQVAGVLNQKSGGPGIRPPLPEELTDTLLKDQWSVTADESEHFRRSIYVFARRNLRYPIFEAFDRPSANESCSRRYVSTTAPQSLHLLNSEFTFTMSKLVAANIRRLNAESGVEEVRRTFLQVLRREPTSLEQDEVRVFLDDSTATGQDGLLNLCLSLFNSNEFVFLE
ncbi:MAG: DUF1549 and DUF1553 domain-containing protein [Planctomycetaceae bacterium]